MSITQTNFFILALLFVYMSLFYLMALKTRNYSLVDIAWPFGFLISSFVSKTVVSFFVVLWSLRLGYHLGKRNINAPEDPRYTKYRLKWGKRSDLNAFIYFFMFQGLLIYLISAPIIFGKNDLTELSFINYIGMAIFGCGLILETYSDHYLKKFKRQHPHQLCLTGPWKLCRFPNYLGEIVLWYGLYLISFSSENWWTILSPILLNILMVKLTGIPPLEEKYRLRPEYKKYASKTPRLLFVKPV